MNTIPNIEEYILGSFIIHKEVQPLIGKMNPDWFTKQTNKDIAKSLVQVYTEGLSIDLTSVYRASTKYNVSAYDVANLSSMCTGCGNTQKYLLILECDYKATKIRNTMSELVQRQEPIDVVRTRLLAEIDELTNTNFKPTERMSKALATAIDQVIEVSQRGTGIMGKPTGWRFLDKYIGGYNEGELLIIAGRPGMGKTAFAMSLGIDFAKLGNHVLFFSLEMSIPQLAKRIISHEANVANYKVRNGQLS